MSDLTADELLAGISAALSAEDLPAVVDLMHALAVVDPHSAGVLYDAMTKQEITVKIPLGGAR